MLSSFTKVDCYSVLPHLHKAHVASSTFHLKLCNITFAQLSIKKMSCGMLMKLPITNAASNCLFNKHLCPTKQANFVYLTLHEKKQFCKLFENKNCVKMKSNVSTKDFPQNQWTAVGRCKLCGNSFLSVSSVWHKNAFPVLPLLTWIKVHPKKMPNWNTIE